MVSSPQQYFHNPLSVIRHTQNKAAVKEERTKRKRNDHELETFEKWFDWIHHTAKYLGSIQTDHSRKTGKMNGEVEIIIVGKDGKKRRIGYWVMIQPKLALHGNTFNAKPNKGEPTILAYLYENSNKMLFVACNHHPEPTREMLHVFVKFLMVLYCISHITFRFEIFCLCFQFFCSQTLLVWCTYETMKDVDKSNGQAIKHGVLLFFSKINNFEFAHCIGED